jgi:hypothetical protein
MQGIQRMATAAEMQQFVSLWSLVMQVQRSNEPDQFTWRFTTSGVYTSSSAYRAQFHGSYAHYEWNRVWKAPVEPKCKFFSWLLLQNKLWTADWLARHGNPANTICQLCHTQQETAFHITAQCTFSTAVWTQLANWMGITSTSPQLSSFNSLKQWWTAMTTTGIGDSKQRACKFIYTVWNLWKERCRRLYDNKAMPLAQLQAVIRLDVKLHNTARRTPLYSEIS